MPAIHHQIHIERPPEFVWDAVRDVGALHSRLVPGFVTATEMLAGVSTPTRRVTFANGVVADEVIVDNDDERRRLAWSVKGIKSVEHHNGVMTVLDAEGGTLVTWTADVLPAELVDRFSPMMAMGLATMKSHLERS
jgi:carbon monoxide dehydrogenase subunit G